MVVVDGIVMGPTHCAFPNCDDSLDNARGESFCTDHKLECYVYVLVLTYAENKVKFDLNFNGK